MACMIRSAGFSRQPQFSKTHPSTYFEKSDTIWSEPKIADALNCGFAAVQRTRKCFCRQ